MFKSSVFNLQEASSDKVQEFLNSFDTVLSDCDGKLYVINLMVYTFYVSGHISMVSFIFAGVLWINNNAIPGSAEAMNYFRKLGKRIFYVTNNSTKIRSDFAIKAQQLGFIAEPVVLFKIVFKYNLYLSCLICFKIIVKYSINRRRFFLQLT